jgi:ubiquinol-cytochrome c reductase cytochrome b subunit
VNSARADSVGATRGAKLLAWIDERFPLSKMMREHATEYYAGKNFNVWYVFGVLAMVVLVIQLISGIFLTMNYKPAAADAFASVEYIMRDVEWGWLIRYIHSTGASAFFIVVYLHMFRAMLYGSYKNPRELLWLIGMLIYVALMAEGFFGYLLPWGQMSYWGAQVIISLFGALPVVGDPLVEWIRGDYNISDITLNRFFALHVIALPLALVMLVVMHILALHETGSNNPDGVEIKKNKGPDGIPIDGVAFHPYYTSKDLVAIIIFLILFCAVIFFAPEMGGYFLEHANFEPANTLKTPEHIAPVWYFTPFYAILRAVPSKLGGVILMGAAIFVLFLLPWLDRAKTKSIRYRGFDYKIPLTVFAISFLVLGYLGLQPATGVFTFLARVFSAAYYGFFIYLAVYTGRDTGVTAKTGISFLLALTVIWMLFGDTFIKGLSAGPTMEELALYFGSLVYSLVFVGFFAYVCFKAGREQDGPVPDRLTYHG